MVTSDHALCARQLHFLLTAPKNSRLRNECCCKPRPHPLFNCWPCLWHTSIYPGESMWDHRVCIPHSIKSFPTFSMVATEVHIPNSTWEFPHAHFPTGICVFQLSNYYQLGSDYHIVASVLISLITNEPDDFFICWLTFGFTLVNCTLISFSCFYWDHYPLQIVLQEFFAVLDTYLLLISYKFWTLHMISILSSVICLFECLHFTEIHNLIN